MEEFHIFCVRNCHTLSLNVSWWKNGEMGFEMYVNVDFFKSLSAFSEISHARGFEFNNVRLTFNTTERFLCMVSATAIMFCEASSW